MTVPAPHVLRMAPYALADTGGPDGVRPVSLAQNESLRPPSPRATEAAAAALSGARLYPDPGCRALRAGLAELHGIPAEGIVCGAGSLDLIAALARVYSGPGRAVLVPSHAYPFFATAAQMAGARLDTGPGTGLTVSVDALVSAVRPDTGLVFVANPANPTGTRIPTAEIARLRDGLRADILLVVDEAYGELAGTGEGSCFDLVRAGNTVVLRTFSKAYGLAGFRVGWGLFPDDVGTQTRKLLNPNNVSSAAQSAALAALGDQDYMHETCRLTARVRDAAAARLRRSGFAVPPSHTNFLLLDLGDADAARSADRALRSDGIHLRAQGGAGLPHALRMTVGPAAAMEAAVGALEAWIGRERE